MAAILFENNERRYLAWLEQNPAGLVLNCRKKFDQSYLPLHRAQCFHIRQYTKRMSDGAFTEREYVKVCAADEKSLRDWIHYRGAKAFSVRCPHCMPGKRGSRD